MAAITEESQAELAEQLRTGIKKIGNVCKNPIILSFAEQYANELLTKFNEYEGNARLLANPNPKELVQL